MLIDSVVLPTTRPFKIQATLLKVKKGIQYCLSFSITYIYNLSSNIELLSNECRK